MTSVFDTSTQFRGSLIGHMSKNVTTRGGRLDIKPKFKMSLQKDNRDLDSDSEPDSISQYDHRGNAFPKEKVKVLGEIFLNKF